MNNIVCKNIFKSFKHESEDMPVLDNINLSISKADRLAISMMVNANINPMAMSDFFKTLLKENNEKGAIEFLRTHPLTRNRIIETENLASKYRGNFQHDSFGYQFVSARVSIKKLNTRKFIKDFVYNEDYIVNSPNKVVDHYAYGL